MEATPVTNNGSENQHGATNVNTANPSGDEERKETDSFDDEEQINLGITINVEEPSEARLESESLLSLLGPVTPLSSEPITITDLEASTDTRLLVYKKACTKLSLIPLSTFVKSITESEISLQHLGITPLEATAISVALRNIDYVDKLSLADNRLTDLGAGPIFDTFSFSNKIKELNVSRNKIGFRSLTKLTELLDENCNLTTLILTHNDMTDKDLKPLIAGLQESAYILSVDISHNQISGLSGEMLGHFLEKNSYILYFDISWNMLGPKGVKGICKGLVKNVTLEHFILSYNNIGTKGCLHLKNALTSNVGLKILDISTNNIMSKGVVDLAKGLMSNTQLEKLYLHGNVFGSEAVDSLINVLNSQNSGLKYLDIRNISITKEQEAKLQKTREKRLFEINHHPWVTGRDFTFL